MTKMALELKIGKIYTLKSINQRTKIVWENVEPGGVNFDKALVGVETLGKSPNIFFVPASLADKYLTTDPPRGRLAVILGQ